MEKKTKFKKNWFRIDQGRAYPGFSDSKNIDGWVCPMFTRDTVEKMTFENINIKYNYLTDAYEIVDKKKAMETNIYYGKDIQVCGIEMHVYDIGAKKLSWEEYSEEKIIELKANIISDIIENNVITRIDQNDDSLAEGYRFYTISKMDNNDHYEIRYHANMISKDIKVSIKIDTMTSVQVLEIIESIENSLKIDLLDPKLNKTRLAERINGKCNGMIESKLGVSEENFDNEIDRMIIDALNSKKI